MQISSRVFSSTDSLVNRREFGVFFIEFFINNCSSKERDLIVQTYLILSFEFLSYLIIRWEKNDHSSTFDMKVIGDIIMFECIYLIVASRLSLDVYHLVVRRGGFFFFFFARISTSIRQTRDDYEDIFNPKYWCKRYTETRKNTTREIMEKK